MTTFKSLFFGSFLVAVATVSPAKATATEQTPALPACSIRYGYLMADHWLTVDLAQQIKRALSYSHAAEADKYQSEFEQLRRRIAEAEQKLMDARNLYKTLFGTNSAGEIAELGGLLDQITVAEAENEKIAAALLQNLGEEASGKKFQAVPVSREALAPGWVPSSAGEARPKHPKGWTPNNEGRVWDEAQLIGDHYQPKRILFGSTGKTGDDRALPLRFDFGSGVFGFYIPMAASNRLDVAGPIQDRADPMYAWMKTHHAGCYYWAGVYNNQNTILRRGFLRSTKTMTTFG
jgi:hypothetical protein